MKFVGDTLSVSSVSADGSMHTVSLPFYHRAAVGVFPGTTLFAVPLTSTNEVVLTPIDPEKWGDLWRLEATVKDLPGSAKSLVETLVANNVNVLVHEGVSEAVKQGPTVHQVFEILDLANYADDIDGRSETRNSGSKSMLKPNHLVNKLIAGSADYLNQAHERNGWELQFDRMEFFFRNKEARFNSVELTLNVDNEVHVPSSLMKELALVRDDKPLPLHIISDTEQKYVKLRVLAPEKYYVLFEVEHIERVGAIDELMSVFRNRNANMIDSYSRLKSINRSALFYALAEFDKKVTKRNLESMLKELACTSSAVSVVLKGAYGRNGPALEKLALPESVSIRQGPADRKSLPQRRRPQLAGDRDEELKGRSRYKLGAPYYVDGRGSSEWTLNTAQVFMAVPFGDKAYTEFYDHYIAKPVKNAGLEPFRADRVPARARRQSIIEKIEEGIARSRFVIADITDSNPNVIYEVGLAVGISKPVLLLCDSKHFDAREIPFDFQPYELIEYSPYGADRLKVQLADKIAQLKEDTP